MRIEPQGRADLLTAYLKDIRKLVSDYPALTHTWRFATSAVLAAGSYYAADEKHPPKANRNEDSFIEDTIENIDAVLAGNGVSLDWVRGFWFNAAVMRLDSLWERLFKLFVPPEVDCNGPSLYRLVQARSSCLVLPYQASSFGLVREVVNKLKHEPGGAEVDNRESRDLPLKALADFLAVTKEPVFENDLTALGKSVIAGKRKRTGRPDKDLQPPGAIVRRRG